ncbi:MAG: cobyric acid synthase [Lachnospiraceae bacterium]|nr:cobyric acid synthase [Lachnospiraceae bacterium]
MAKPLMIQGTMSNAGKSLLCAALCRIFRQDGHCVAPFKSQNMALNSYITEEGLEMGRAQAVQAEAAGIRPSVLMNPVLLKPTTDTGSQIIVNGKVLGNMPAAEYFKYKKQLVPEIMRAYDALASENDIIVIEGAGSPAEINLKTDDIVNMGLAKMAEAPVLLAGDIDRGGVFAQLYGTIALLEPDERSLVKATVINKFRGDRSILAPGLDMLYDLVKIPCAGVIPYMNVDIDDEDSLSERLRSGERREIDIAIICLPRISNFTDFSPFERFPGVSVRYVRKLSGFGKPDMIILPGTKSTISDLKWMRQNGLEAQILKAASRGTPVFGICGGLQMLGKRISDPDEAEGGGEISGMGLLDIETVFSCEKTRRQAEGTFSGLTGMFEGLNGIGYRGYEMHLGQSGTDRPVLQSRNVYGSYIHGLFDANNIAGTVVKALYEARGLRFDENAGFDAQTYREGQYDKLAAEVRKALDMELIYSILENGI